MHTFAVSDVELGNKVLKYGDLKDNLEVITRAPVEACRANLDRLCHGRTNPFVTAAYWAFAWHLPLTLTPDDVWLCIAQGFGTHVKLNAEALRSRFVSHQGKVELEVRRDSFLPGAPDNDWPGVVAELTEQMAADLGKRRDLIVADFSTSGPVERTASEVVLMGAMSTYFDLGMVTLCGIPSITLLGTVADWRAVRDRARVLGEFGLQPWVHALEPVLDQFVAAAEGMVDLAFWQSFVKYRSRSGGPELTGWINTLFPYLEDHHGGDSKPNPHVEDDDSGRGPSLHDFPGGYTVAPFTWRFLLEERPMEFLGGFVGISQDEHTLALRPAIGWAVRRTPTALGPRRYASSTDG